MIIKLGDRLVSAFTGAVYQVAVFKGQLAVLKGEDPSNKVYTEADSLTLFYERGESEAGREDFVSLAPPDKPIRETDHPSRFP